MAMRTQTASINRISLVAAVLCAIFAVATIRSKAAGEYAIVTNASNSYRADESTLRTVLKQLYLKQRSQWPNSIAAKPFGRPAGSSEHQVWLSHILGLRQSELAKHWLSLKQRNGETAPQEVESDEILLKLVAKYPGAFGVVPRDKASSARGVVVLLTIP